MIGGCGAIPENTSELTSDIAHYRKELVDEMILEV
jgi:hypothetical protein